MSDRPRAPGELRSLLLSAERTITEAPQSTLGSVGDDIAPMLARVEAATPGGAPLHTQLDNVRKWLRALERPADHEQFGGTAHLRSHVLTQLRLALGALDDYEREMR
jgi:hypothetical protein